ncbi:globoside alpha-1,3-N-acetylgalactosaminyltransferase 1-like [Brachyhypopomus gauderio]|uniref:globoside alpha-1,3-N-acetylgalactosaminyltransferase 1-like n=1 Tax=Brachyhypopomus gauderio TaxID=698409 RepID=UPI004041BB3F
MALFPYSRLSSGFYCGNRRQLLLLCVCVLAGLIYFMAAKRISAVSTFPTPVLSEERQARLEGKDLPTTTPWGAPLVWGDSESSTRRRNKFALGHAQVGLAVLAVGNYNRFLRNFLSSAEHNFLLNVLVTYYVLTDKPRELDPPPTMGPTRNLRIIPVAEMPGWTRLSLRRTILLASIVKEQIHQDVDYVYCADVDQEFMNPVGTEILGRLTATLHPEFFGRPRHSYPYETDPDSLAYVADEEGDYYYTSEFYGGLCSEVLAMLQACSLLILQDQDRGVQAQQLEESYLNRYLVNRKPTCVLSPEYSWWESPQTPDIPTQRLHSIGRQCLATGKMKEDTVAC